MAWIFLKCLRSIISNLIVRNHIMFHFLIFRVSGEAKEKMNEYNSLVGFSEACELMCESSTNK